MTKKLFVLTAIVLTTTVLGGCQLGTDSTSTTEEVTERPTTTLKGKVVQSGATYSLVSGTKSTEIVSKKINLGTFLQKEVEVTGEFSGTTLYVDSIK